MKLHGKFRKLNQLQKGMTLIELLIALAITGLVLTGITSAITQVFVVNSADSNRMVAVKQVENALDWLNRDIQMSTSDNITSPPANPLIALNWTDLTDNTTYDVSYNLDPSSHVLERSESVNGGSPHQTFIAQDISSLSFNGSDDSLITVDITSTVNGFRSASETRTLQVSPRVSQSQ